MAERIAVRRVRLFHENAAEFGLPYDGPPDGAARVGSRSTPGARSARWCGATAPPELVLLHGGAQNAHTWDTVAMALGRPLVAIDLPGHGHSDGRRRPAAASRRRATPPTSPSPIRALAPNAERRRRHVARRA